MQDLLEIRKNIAGKTTGRKPTAESLNRSMIILLVAGWEALIKDLAEGSFNELLQHGKNQAAFSCDVLCLALKDLPNWRDIRKLSGSRWKLALRKHKEAILKQYIVKMNTAKPKQVDLLFSGLIGIPNISSHWHWKGVSAVQASQALEELIKLRQSLSGEPKGRLSVKRADVEHAMYLIYRLSVITFNHVRTYVHARTRVRPWVLDKFEVMG